MRALVLALSLVALATAGPSVAYQPQEEQPSEQAPRSDRGGDRNAGGCRSSAGDVSTAEEFCETQLNCAGQGKKIKCGGRPNNWACKCV